MTSFLKQIGFPIVAFMVVIAALYIGVSTFTTPSVNEALKNNSNLTVVKPLDPLQKSTNNQVDEKVVQKLIGANAITVDTSKQYQKMLGFGGFISRFDEPHMLYGQGQGNPKDIVPEQEKEKILDDVYSDLYLNSITLGIGPRASPSYNWLSSWELQNDNNDPQTINWNALRFNRNYYDNLFKTIQNAEKKITGRGDKLTLIFKHSWGVENWLSNEGGNTVIKPALEEEYAENLVIFILWIKNTYGLEADYIVPMNEPDGAGGMGSEQYARIIKYLGPMLEKYNLSTKISGPETYLPSTAPRYLKAIAADPQAAKYLKLISFHGYDRDLSVNIHGDANARKEIANYAKILGADVIQGELSACCKENQKTFWNNKYTQAMAWANDFYFDITNANAGAVDMQLSFWQIDDPSAYVLIKYDQNKNYLGYEKAKFYYVLGQFINYIKPGMVRIDAKSGDEKVLVSAYQDRQTKQVVIVAINNAKETKNFKIGFVQSANSPNQISVIRSSETENWIDLGLVSKNKDGIFEVTLAPSSVTTYSGIGK